MKFSVAVRICWPEGTLDEGGGWWWGLLEGGAEKEGVPWPWLGVPREGVGSVIVAGRFTRRRSVARGHSICKHEHDQYGTP